MNHAIGFLLQKMENTVFHFEENGVQQWHLSPGKIGTAPQGDEPVSVSA